MKPGLLSSALGASWWTLPDSHVRVAFALLALADQRGSSVVDLTGDELASVCRTSRTSVRRALDALVGTGFCEVAHKEGRGGATSISITSLGQLEAKSEPGLTCNCADDAASLRGQLEAEGSQHVTSNNEDIAASLETSITPDAGQLKNGPNHYELVENSLAALGDLGQFRGQLEGQRNQKVSPQNGEIAASLASFDLDLGIFAPNSSRARVQDLLRSSQKDLRSSTLEYITRPSVAARSPQTAAPQSTDQDVMDTTPPPASEPAQTSIEPTAPGKHKRKRVDPGKIPERAWAAADYLRAKTLAKNGAAVAGMKPWSYGWTWTGGKAEHLGDGSRDGLRLAWANSFRLFHAVLKGALAQGGKPSTDEYTWDEIAKTVQWLFHAQPVGVRFIVECPDTLRDKWDRIQDVRKSSSGPRPQAKSNHTGPAMVRPKFSDDDLPPGVRSRR